jgi:Spy/CpxP family protein refolding chaperone
VFTARSWAHARGPGCWGHAAHRHAGTAEELRERMGQRAQHMLDRLDASDEQRARIDAILDRVAPQLHALHERGRSLKDDASGAMDGGDRDAMELARKRSVALFDEGSALALSGLQEAYDVLDPEQRTQVREHFDRFRHR